MGEKTSSLKLIVTWMNIKTKICGVQPLLKCEVPRIHAFFKTFFKKKKKQQQNFHTLNQTKHRSLIKKIHIHMYGNIQTDFVAK